MDPNKNEIIEETPEEQAAEQELLKGSTSEDEIREKIAEDLGIDPEEESDLLDKLVKREQSHHEKLSKAIKQKITIREKLKTSESKPKEKSEAGKTQTKTEESNDEIIDRKLQERLDARDLEALELSDEVKAEVKDLAKLKGISVREAAKKPYITSLIEEEEKKAKIEAATPTRKSRGSYQKNIDPSKPLDPNDFDLDTDEGIKAWREARAARDKVRK